MKVRTCFFADELFIEAADECRRWYSTDFGAKAKIMVFADPPAFEYVGMFHY